MNKHMLTAVALSALLAACSSLNKSSDAAPDAAALIDHEARGELMYQMLLAEMAGRRGRVDLAMEGYLRASRSIDDPRIAERAARLAVYAKAWDSAAEAGQRWVELEPDNLAAHRLLVGVHLKQGDVAASADTYEHILRLTEQSFDAGAASVLASLAREPRLKLAVEVAQELSARHPKSAMGYFLVARLSGASGQHALSLEAYDATLLLKPNMGRANLYRAQLMSTMGRTSSALSDLHSYLKRNPGDVASQLGLARLLIDVGRHEEAEAHSSALYQRYSERGDVMFEIALMAIDNKRLDAAQSYLQRSIELNHKVGDAHYFLGRVAQIRREYAVAVSAYDQVQEGQYHLDAGIRAAELSAQSNSVDVGLGRLTALAGRFSADDVAQKLALAEAGILQDAGRETQALEVLNRALQSLPSDHDLKYARGLAAERTGDAALFEADMRAVFEADPSNAHAMNALGYSLAVRGERLDEAKTLIEKAHKLRPDDPAIIDSMGWLAFKLGDHESSITYLRRAYQLLSDPEIAAHLTEALWVAGQRDEAQRLLDAALGDAPDDARLRSVQQQLMP